MPKVTDSFRNAQILADFCNLDASAPPHDPRHPDYFRRHHPDFVPNAWWDEPLGPEPLAYYRDQEEIARNVLKKIIQDAQEKNIPVDDLVKNDSFRDLEREPQRWSARKSMKHWQVTQRSLWDWWGQKHKDDITSLVALLNSIFDPDPKEAWSRMLGRVFRDGVPENVSLGSVKPFPQSDIPMQTAIVFLYENSWRARLCANCNKQFVAAVPRSKYCSDTCSQGIHNRQQLKSWHTHKKKWRPTKNQKQLRKRRTGGK